MWWRLPKPYGDMSSGRSELHSSHFDANIIPIYASLAQKKNHQERLAKLPVLAIRCSLQSATIGRCGIPSSGCAMAFNGDVLPSLPEGVGRSLVDSSGLS